MILERYGLVFGVVQLSHNSVASSGYFSSIIALAGRRPSADGLAQSFQQPSEMRLAMLHPRHAIPLRRFG